MMHRRQWALSAAAIAGLSLLGCDSQSSLPVEGMDLTGAEHGKDFALFDAQGQQRSVKDFAGSVVVVFFGYTQCPDVCPTSLARMARLRKQLGADGIKFNIVFVSVDPAAYRDPRELAAALQTDPIARLRQRWQSLGHNLVVLDTLENEATAAVQAALDAAFAAPWPEASAAFTDIQTTGAGAWF